MKSTQMDKDLAAFQVPNPWELKKAVDYANYFSHWTDKLKPLDYMNNASISTLREDT